MVSIRIRIVAAALCVAWGSPLRGASVAADTCSQVMSWNSVVLDAIRAETMAPPLAVRNLAIVHRALLEACSASRGRNDALMAISGCAAASALFPGQRARFEVLRDSVLDRLDPAVTSEEWIAAAALAATEVDARAGDGACRSVTYIPQTGSGQWRRTAPFFRPPEMPQWARVQTFALAQPEAYRLPGPPAPGSAAFVAALDEVRTLGGRGSTLRTAEQSLIARFWSDFSYTHTPPGHWNEIAAAVARDRGLDERDSARLFERLNVALADAAIVCWQEKYTHNFWRPITALAGEDWQPMLNTPAHPEYPSGHSVFSGAAAEVLADFFGGDACSFVVRSDSVPGVERRFESFSAAALEIGNSRIYAGIHYRFSCEDGLALGRSIAREVVGRDASGHATARRESHTEVAAR